MTKRSGEAAGFDPRFDPAFQPGYRPPEVEPSGWEVLRATATQAAHAARSLRSDAPAEAVGDTRAAGESGLGVAPVTAESSESAAESPRRNPFVLVLWVISVLFTLVGIGMVRWSFTLTERLQTSTNASQVDFQLNYILQQSGPLVIVLGLAVATSTVFLHAQTWYRRRA